MKNKIILKDEYAEIIINSPKYGLFKSKIDVEDIDKIKDLRWYIRKSKYNNSVRPFYVFNSLNDLQLHRFVTNCPSDKVIDHINHDTLDNRKQNLRICTFFENMQNQTANKSGKVGVFWNNNCQKYQAVIKIKRKNIFIGFFKTFEDAANARINAEMEYVYGTDC